MKNKSNLILVLLLSLFVALGCAKLGNTTSTQNTLPTGKALLSAPVNANASLKLAPSPAVPIAKKAPPTPSPSPTPDELDVYASKDKAPADDGEGSGARGGYKTTDGRASDSGRYITGPGGGCYYLNGNGNKTYVDHSFCGRSASPAAAPRSLSAPTVKSADTSASSGASAKCRDGSLSFSASRRGTCSHHGGVAEWY